MPLSTESAQKIHASSGGCKTHANQFWWEWPLRFWKFFPFLLTLKFGQISLSDHGVKKFILLESAQKIHASRD